MSGLEKANKVVAVLGRVLSLASILFVAQYFVLSKGILGDGWRIVLLILSPILAFSGSFLTKGALRQPENTSSVPTPPVKSTLSDIGVKVAIGTIIFLVLAFSYGYWWQLELSGNY